MDDIETGGNGGDGFDDAVELVLADGGVDRVVRVGGLMDRCGATESALLFQGGDFFRGFGVFLLKALDAAGADFLDLGL